MQFGFAHLSRSIRAAVCGQWRPKRESEPRRHTDKRKPIRERNFLINLKDSIQLPPLLLADCQTDKRLKNDDYVASVDDKVCRRSHDRPASEPAGVSIKRRSLELPRATPAEQRERRGPLLCQPLASAEELSPILFIDSAQLLSGPIVSRLPGYLNK